MQYRVNSPALLHVLVHAAVVDPVFLLPRQLEALQLLVEQFRTDVGELLRVEIRQHNHLRHTERARVGGNLLKKS